MEDALDAPSLPSSFSVSDNPATSSHSVISGSPLMAAMFAFAIAQSIKCFSTWYKERRFDAKQLIGSGGMPSSHSATVTALAVSVGLREGFQGPIFAVAAIMACVVMYDASGVRLHAGRQAENQDEQGVDNNNLGAVLQQLTHAIAALNTRIDGLEVNQQPGRRMQQHDDELEVVTPPINRRVTYNLFERPKREVHVKLPSFAGSTCSEEYLEWIEQVERIFDYHDLSDARKCRYANIWWSRVVARFRDLNHDISWDDMKNAMKKKFLPDNYRQDLLNHMQTFKQVISPGSAVAPILGEHAFTTAYAYASLLFPICNLPAEHPLSNTRPLHELLGHTPPQVVAGAMLGIFTALIFFSISKSVGET